MKHVLKILIMCIILLCFAIAAKAEIVVPDIVRIGLFYNSTALSEVTLSGTAELTCITSQEEMRNSEFVVSATETGFKIGEFEETLTQLDFYPTNGYISVNNKPYRGFIRLTNRNGKITVINVVKLEDYLYGVVPLEMSTGWPVEALKSQAICARTYSASSIGRFESYGFDMTDTTLSQVYGGVNVEKSDCTQAVDETRGMIVSFDGKIASTFYFATSHGQTLNVKDVWGSSGYPYLVSVDDSLQDNVIPDKGAWKVTYTRGELNNLLARKGLNIGEITDIKTELNEQGAVLKLILTGTEGEKVYQRESARNFFGLRSQVYTIEKHSSGNASMSVLSANGTETTPGNTAVISASGITNLSDMKVLTANGIEFKDSSNTFDSITINGLGYGHGIGMSQNGAKAMAKAGYTYEQIITHYFTGVEITQIY